MLPDGKMIICSLSIIDTYEIRSLMKIMLMKAICVRLGIRLGLMSFIGALWSKPIRLRCVIKRPDFVPHQNSPKQKILLQLNMFYQVNSCVK